MGGKRLAVMAEILPATDCLADIGTDHGGLLISLVRSGKIRRGIGVEIAPGPFGRALANVRTANLEDRIEIRAGNGMLPLLPGEATACAIAGMGGKTIIAILDRRPEIAEDMTWLLLQPMSLEGALRDYLQKHHWRICGERLAEDRGVPYPVILAERGDMDPLSPEEAEFGPLLLAENPLLLRLAMMRKIRKVAGIVRQLEFSGAESARIKKARLVEQIEVWEKLLR